MLTGWTGRKWDACRLERSTAPKGSSRMGLSTSCARRRPRPQAGHGFSYAVNSSFPHRNLADLSDRPAHAVELQSLNGLSLALTLSRSGDVGRIRPALTLSDSK